MQDNKPPKETTKFLQHSSNPEENAQVLFWYDQLGFDTENSDEIADQITFSAKERLMQQLILENKRRTFRMWSRITAAAAILLIGFFAWKTNYSPQSTLKDATDAQLAAVNPAKEHAIITLETGEEIDLDRLAINESIQIGDIKIIKNSKGEVSYINSKTGEAQMNSIRVPKASIYSLTLSDGSKVTLNAESKLTYPSAFAGKDRTVKLEGEGYFDVKHTSNDSRFIVETQKQEIEVLGTKFNIKAFPKEENSYTTLASGSVRVKSNVQNNPQILKPGQQARTDNGGKLTVKNADLEKVLGWTNGQFVFDGENNGETFEEISRWYDVDISYQRNSKNIEYVGKIPRNLTLDKLIELMSYAGLHVDATIDHHNRINLKIK